MEDVAGVQDVFCGTETVIYMKKGSASLSPQAVEDILSGYKIAFEGVKRDDSVIL
ncbi:MAG: hypothetical protein JKY61_07865 [Planctomycetes bacterium]|nr:hypothetical protein [Planctomycetota bacterium]